MRRIKVALLAMGMTAMMTGCTPTMQNEAVITDDTSYEAVSAEVNIVAGNDENNVNAGNSDSGEIADAVSGDENSENEEVSELAETEEKENDEAAEEIGTIQKELAEVEAKSVEIEKKTWDVLPQQDLNQLTGEWYELWDAELNSLWSRIIEKVTPEKKEELLADQREWIKRKEAAIKASGEEALGGSLQPQLENGTAMRYTRKRSYFLAGVLATELGEKFEIPAEVEPSLVDVDPEPEPE